jgi:hypothetical protein
VQARPITTTDGAVDPVDTPSDDHELTTAGIAEMLPGVLPPLVWQLAGTAVEEAIRASFDSLGALDPDLVAPHALVRRVRGRAALDLDGLTAVAAQLPGGSGAAVEHGFFGVGEPPPPGPRAAWLPSLRHELRVERARRRSLHDARVTAVAADRTPDPAGGPGWFAAIVEVEAAALRAGTAPPLVPGMPAEVYVTTGARSALEYLLAPIDLFRRRALREP